jgi:hypothetical protein
LRDANWRRCETRPDAANMAVCCVRLAGRSTQPFWFRAARAARERCVQMRETCSAHASACSMRPGPQTRRRAVGVRYLWGDVQNSLRDDLPIVNRNQDVWLKGACGLLQTSHRACQMPPDSFYTASGLKKQTSNLRCARRIQNFVRHQLGTRRLWRRLRVWTAARVRKMRGSDL